MALVAGGYPPDLDGIGDHTFWLAKALADKGYDQTFGARPLKRKIQDLILDELAMQIIEGKVKTGDKVIINLGLADKIEMVVTA